MKKNALLLFQAAQLGENIHPFLHSEVEAFCKQYDHVHLVCFEFDSSITELNKFSNLTVHGVKMISFGSILGAIIKFFTCYGWEDVWTAIKNKRFSLGYLKSSIKILVFGASLLNCADKVLAKSCKDIKWVVEGYWLSGPAFAAANLKRKYPDIFAFSRAHSSEIDFIRNPYCICQYKKFISEYLDACCFISEWAKNNYESVIMPLHNIKKSPTNYVIRLGVNKCHEVLNLPSSDGVFRVLTCSRAVPLKRLDLLAKALINFSYSKPIEWTHIGDGPEMGTIINNCKEKKEGFTFNFLGNMPNKAVHDYLSTKNVDLFVNVSKYEGLPISIMEAMSYGIAVVATDAGATNEIVNDSNGILLDINATEKMISTAIEKMITVSTTEFQNYRDSAYRTWSETYNKDANYQELFSKLEL